MHKLFLISVHNKPNLNSVKRLLIIRLSSLGDILLTTPFIRTVKTLYPSIEIDFILRSEYKDLLINNPHITKLILFNRDENLNKELYESISEANYDLVVDLQNNFRSRKLRAKSNARFVKFNKRNFDKFLLVKFKINRFKDQSSIPERYAQTIGDFKLDENGLDLFTNNESSNLIIGNNIFIGFCPGSRHFTKRWPAAYFIKLGNELLKNGFQVVLFGGKSDREICDEIKQKIQGSIDLSNDDDILQTVADIKKCKLIVCNDSGLMHAASAAGVKVAAIFGSTVKEFGFTPYKCQHLVFENKSLSCRPCSHIGRSICPEKHFKCLEKITPDYILPTLINLAKS